MVIQAIVLQYNSSPTSFCFFFSTCQGHNFFVISRIWACEVSLETYLNVEYNHESKSFLPVRTNYSLDKLEKFYLEERVRLHGVLMSIILDRDPRLTLRFWGKLKMDLTTRLNFSMNFHPQMDG